VRVAREEFETLVEQALDDLPEEFARMLDNVAVVVEEEPTDEDLESVDLDPEDELFGLYQGTPLAARALDYDGLPDRIVIFRGPILRECASRREVIREVRQTVLHELGHHFGLDEEEMPY
jgi:predicted Zn-dependent protease with MMP-like domain